MRLATAPAQNGVRSKSVAESARVGGARRADGEVAAREEDEAARAVQAQDTMHDGRSGKIKNFPFGSWRRRRRFCHVMDDL